MSEEMIRGNFPRRDGISLLTQRFAYGLALVTIVSVALTLHAAKKQPPAHPIDINAATIQELEQLPGVGPTTAAAIVQFRTRSGRFRRVEDLLAVRGISESKLNKMRPYITLGPPLKKQP